MINIAVNHPLKRIDESSELESFKADIFERDSLRIECILPVQDTYLIYVEENNVLVYDAQRFDADYWEIPESDSDIQIRTYKAGKWEEEINKIEAEFN